MSTNNLILLGTLPDQLTSVLQQRQVQCSVHLPEIVVNQYVSSSDHRNESNINIDSNASKNIVEWIDQSEGIAWQATLISQHLNNLQCTFAQSTSVPQPFLTGNKQCYYIEPSSWTHSRSLRKTISSITSSNEISSKTKTQIAVSSSNPISQQQQQQQMQLVANKNDVSAQNQTPLSSVTGCHVQRYDNFDLLYRSQAHHSIVQQILYFLAPTRRYLHQILRYVFAQTLLHDQYRAKYSVKDVQQLLEYFTSVNAMQQYDLNAQGFVKIDIERFDSTRIKQNVANRAFLCLSSKFRHLALHETDKTHTDIQVADEQKNKKTEQIENDSKSLYAEMAHVLRTMELYADRDVMISARTGGGGIMAGLASHKRLRQNEAHSQHDTTDSDVQQPVQNINTIHITANDHATDDSTINEMEKSENYCSGQRQNNDQIHDNLLQRQTFMLHDNSGAQCSSADYNWHVATDKANTATIVDGRLDKNLSENAKFDRQNKQLRLQQQRQQLYTSQSKRQVKVTSFSQCGLELHNQDLSTLVALHQVQSASEQALQRYSNYYFREQSSDHQDSHDKAQDQNDKFNSQSNECCSSANKMIITSQAQFKAASTVYTQLLSCFNTLHNILVRHQTFTNNVGRWCAQYLAQCATKQLITQLSIWQERQRQPRRSLTQLYVRLHKATYTLERELEEYATLHALMLL